MKIDFEVLGEDLAAAHLDELGARAIDMRPALRQVQEVLLAGEEAQIKSQGSFFGSRWAPLAADTLARKDSTRILYDSGELFASLTRPTGKRMRVSRTSLTFGTDVWWARFAAAGTSRGEPQRPIVGVTVTQIGEALQLIFRFLTAGL